MKWIISVLLIAVFSFALCLYLPWWSVAIASFLVTFLLAVKPGKAFLAGFFALLILWGGYSFMISSANNHILAGKITPLILNSEQPFLIIIATALLGAIIGGFAALSGSLLRYAIIK